MTNATLWTSHTGTITRMKEGRGPKAAFVSFTVTIAKKDGSTFSRDAIAFREAMDTVLALGVGARVYIRGPLNVGEKATASGAMRKVTSMTAYDVLHKPLADEPIETAARDVVPTLPEGASLDTHQIYTKRDGTKAWRKKAVRAVATPAPILDSAPVIAQDAAPSIEDAPPPVAQPLASIDPTTISGDTAMGAALLRALMAH